MRRVTLRTVDDVRDAAVALAEFAVPLGGRGLGDPVHEWVTEGRRAQYERAYARCQTRYTPYSSCADLAHWLLMMLGVRDERFVNRGDDDGDLDWIVAVNVSRLVSSPWYTTHGTPERGDIIHVAPPDHVCVLLSGDDSTWITADYGQPYARRHTCSVHTSSRGLMVRGRALRGYISLAHLLHMHAIEADACVPDAFARGEDAPYPGDLPVPDDVVG